MSRRKVERETPDYASMLVRMVKALGRRVADGDPVDLGEITRVRDELDRALHAAVQGQRAAGFSWAEIARELGISRQAAQQRFGSLASTG